MNEYYDGKDPKTSVKNDKVDAYGVAIQWRILSRGIRWCHTATRMIDKKIPTLIYQIDDEMFEKVFFSEVQER